jgi:hypothetical protein
VLRWLLVEHQSRFGTRRKRAGAVTSGGSDPQRQTHAEKWTRAKYEVSLLPKSRGGMTHNAGDGAEWDRGVPPTGYEMHAHEGEQEGPDKLIEFQEQPNG